MGNKRLLGIILNYTLEELKTELNEKMAKFRDTHIAQVKRVIWTATSFDIRNKRLKAKSTIPEMYNSWQTKTEDIIRSARSNISDLEKLDGICDFTINALLMITGERANHVKQLMFEAGINVDHYYNHQEIRQKGIDMNNEIIDFIQKLPTTDGENSIQLLLNEGEKKNAELLQKFGDEIKNRLNSWQTDITNRSDNDRARENEVIPFLLIKMQKLVAEILAGIDGTEGVGYALETEDGNSSPCSCSYKSIDNRAQVIRCVTLCTHWEEEDICAYEKLAKIISLIDLELKAIGL